MRLRTIATSVATIITMRMKNRVRAVASVAFALAILPSVSRAEIVEAIIDTNSDATIGSIGFPAITGDSAAGVKFSLSGYNQSEINSISWTLDATTYAVTALDLYAVIGDASCGFGQNCSYSDLSLSQNGVSRGGGGCSFDADTQTGTCESFITFPSPVSFVLTSIPEPSTWAMMLTGFVGLGYAGCRAQRKSATAAS
jgi:hypothetical protein